MIKSPEVRILAGISEALKAEYESENKKSGKVALLLGLGLGRRAKLAPSARSW